MFWQVNGKASSASQNAEHQKWIDLATKLLMLPMELTREIYFGFRHKSLPLTECLIWGFVANCAVIGNWDRCLWRYLKLPKLQIHSPCVHALYVTSMGLSGFVGWAIYQLLLKRRLLQRLKEAFQSAQLQNGLGRFPGFISDRPLDRACRVLRLSKSNVPKSRFEAAKECLESSLQLYIDAFRDNIETGTIDILYSHRALPALIRYADIKQLAGSSYIVGLTRSRTVSANLTEVPHLLVAGETSSGKSTFLRQLITSLYFDDHSMEMSLIDLKGGLEFGLFQNVKRMTVVGTLEAASSLLLACERELNRRMTLLSHDRVKDINAYNSKIKAAKENSSDCGAEGKSKCLNRRLIVVDEVSEVFLSGDGKSSTEIQAARGAISKIARQGRAVGIHLVLGTQRPDARALDTQIKANLPGKLCFQMADLHSSMVVLGNGRAKDLPCIPGRGIWQRGMDNFELQTPYLSVEEVEALFLQHREAEFACDKSEQSSAPSVPKVIETSESLTRKMPGYGGG